MNNAGKFIVVEGLEGAGKTTAMLTIADYLRPRVSGLVVTREPGGTSIGEVLRRLIKEKRDDEPLTDLSELLLIYASRIQLIDTVIRPALARGDWVLCDRFDLSTFAYQGGGRGLDKDLIQSLSNMSLKGFQPDLLLFLDISPEEGLERARDRGEADRIESESLAFFHRVYFAYHEALKAYHRVQIINASDPLARVQKNILSTLQLLENSNDPNLNQ